jgi:hypothetical protein
MILTHPDSSSPAARALRPAGVHWKVIVEPGEEIHIERG